MHMRRALFNHALFVLAIAMAPSVGCQKEPARPGNEPTGTPPSTARAQSAEGVKGFVPLTLADFETFQGKARPDKPTWTADESSIRCTGSPRGYLYSKRPYRNFTLQVELRFPSATEADAAKANTGFLVYLSGPHRVWPVCLEVQGKFTELATIKGNGKPDPLDAAKVHDNEQARRRARKPLAEWNAIEIVAHEGKLTTKLNGETICQSDPCDLREGPIGIQAEGFPYEIRNLRIRDDSSR
jgi:hypothetical protein